MSDMTEAPSLKEMERGPTRPGSTSNIGLLADIPLRLSVEVGSASMTFAELLDLSEGRVVELDRQANDLLDILVNGTLVAKGEIVEVNARYGIRVVDVVAADRHLTGMERKS
ncbi:MAG: flagellar motor switch protein FliN [Sphingomonadaceae bacterium]|nr:flagellar motor switch protein FliN [Sphingomonadaceae bacterium]